jgi:hypothetical protein
MQDYMATLGVSELLYTCRAYWSFFTAKAQTALKKFNFFIGVVACPPRLSDSRCRAQDANEKISSASRENQLCALCVSSDSGR